MSKKEKMDWESNLSEVSQRNNQILNGSEVTEKSRRKGVTLTPPRALTDEDFLRVTLAAEELSLRDKAITLLLLSSGCRSGEIGHLTIEDIDLKNKTAKIKKPNGLHRIVLFSKECGIALQKYLRTRTLNPEAPLFVNQSGERIQSRTINQITRKLGEKAGIEGPLTPRVCRYTVAKKLIDNQVPLDFISGLLGQTCIKQTSRYAMLSKY